MEIRVVIIDGTEYISPTKWYLLKSKIAACILGSHASNAVQSSMQGKQTNSQKMPRKEIYVLKSGGRPSNVRPRANASQSPDEPM